MLGNILDIGRFSRRIGKILKKYREYLRRRDSLLEAFSLGAVKSGYKSMQLVWFMEVFMTFYSA
jgi:hypothetical protein